MSALPSLGPPLPKPTTVLTHGMATGMARVTPGRSNVSFPSEAGARRGIKNIPPRPSPHMCSFLIALFLLPTPNPIRLPVHNCLSWPHNQQGSAAAVSDTSINRKGTAASSAKSRCTSESELQEEIQPHPAHVGGQMLQPLREVLAG